MVTRILVAIFESLNEGFYCPRIPYLSKSFCCARSNL
jgi:hypothetical protein